MSKKLFLFSALLFGMTVALVPACNGDKCPDTCGFGICLEDGACDCDPGYEYDADGICNVLIQSKFVGIYTASENCVTGPYLVEIVTNADVTKVGIKSSGNFSKIRLSLQSMALRLLLLAKSPITTISLLKVQVH